MKSKDKKGRIEKVEKMIDHGEKIIDEKIVYAKSKKTINFILFFSFRLLFLSPAITKKI